jgi:riboflavin kinase/FMN adenylyltransferase
MKFSRYPQDAPLTKATVITIGNFDGIHLGHQTLIKKVLACAQKQDLDSCVVSMQPLASQFFQGKENISILTGFKCKYELLSELGVDIMCLLNFNQKLAALSAEGFIQKILLSGLNARHIIVGDDFRFGKNRAGDINLLRQYCQPKGVTVEAIATVAQKGQRVSSSLIRDELLSGQFNTVEGFLGRPYSIAGKISRGQQLGRKLGFPTINIRLRNKVVPINGIFCVMVKFKQGEKYMGAASVGTRPTVNGVDKILEVYILDFNKQVYGQNVEILFHHKIRNEVKFDTLSELKRHINDDVLKTRQFFEKQQQQ